MLWAEQEGLSTQLVHNVTSYCSVRTLMYPHVRIFPHNHIPLTSMAKVKGVGLSHTTLCQVQ